jgi:hypothetical protein
LLLGSYHMAGTIPLSLTQQFDEFGKPLSGGLLYIIQAGTVSTPQNPWQDTNLSILMPNPIPLDAAGRVPQFFLADGYIKVRLTDKDGVTQLARDGILVIGPSAGGGGGGAAVDPTTIWQTGMVAVFYGTGQVPGFARANGRSIGNASSGATEAIGNTVLALFQYLYNADPNLPLRNSSGGVIPRTGGDATASGAWTNARQIDLPDWRGRTISGLSDMGAADSLRLTAAYFNGKDPSGNSIAATVLGAAGGAESNLLDATKIPPVTFSGTTGNDSPDHTHQYGAPVPGSQKPNGAGTTPADGTTPTQTGGASTRHQHPFSGAINGGGQAHANVQPTLLTTIYLKL